MGKLDWDKAKQRDRRRRALAPSPPSKRALLRAAAADQPSVFVARFPGTCCHCHIGFTAGTSIGKTDTGYIHALCAVEIREQRLARRAPSRQ